MNDGAGMSETACCSSGRKKHRTEEERQALMNRLSRVEGQIRGIRRMLDEEAYCIDILNQVSAANCALNGFAAELLARHLRSCVADDVRSGGEEKLDEAIRTVRKLMK